MDPLHSCRKTRSRDDGARRAEVLIFKISHCTPEQYENVIKTPKGGADGLKMPKTYTNIPDKNKSTIVKTKHASCVRLEDGWIPTSWIAVKMAKTN